MKNDSNSNREIFEDLLQSGRISSLNIQEREFNAFDTNAAVAMANTPEPKKKKFGKRSARRAAPGFSKAVRMIHEAEAEAKETAPAESAKESEAHAVQTAQAEPAAETTAAESAVLTATQTEAVSEPAKDEEKTVQQEAQAELETAETAKAAEPESEEISKSVKAEKTVQQEAQAESETAETAKAAEPESEEISEPDKAEEAAVQQEVKAEPKHVEQKKTLPGNETTEIDLDLFEQKEKDMMSGFSGEPRRNPDISETTQIFFANAAKLTDPVNDTVSINLDDLKYAGQTTEIILPISGKPEPAAKPAAEPEPAAEPVKETAMETVLEEEERDQEPAADQTEIEAEPETVFAAEVFEEETEPAAQEAAAGKEEKEEEAKPVKRGLFGRKKKAKKEPVHEVEEEIIEEDPEEMPFQEEYEEEAEEEENQVYDPESSLVDDYDYDLYEDKKHFMLSDYKKVEDYLSGQSRQGFHFVRHEGKKYYFHKLAPQDYYYQLLYFSKEPDEEQWEEWRSRGWELIFRSEGKKKKEAGWFVVRNLEVPGSFRDTIENEEEKYRFFRKYTNSCRSTMFLLFICMVICAVMAVLQWAFKGFMAGIIFAVVLFLLALWVFIIYWRMLSKSKKQCRLLKARIRLNRRRKTKEEQVLEDEDELDSEWDALEER